MAVARKVHSQGSSAKGRLKSSTLIPGMKPPSSKSLTSHPRDGGRKTPKSRTLNLSLRIGSGGSVRVVEATAARLDSKCLQNAQLVEWHSVLECFSLSKGHPILEWKKWEPLYLRDSLRSGNCYCGDFVPSTLVVEIPSPTKPEKAKKRNSKSPRPG